MKSFFLFAQLFIIISSISTPSFTITKIDYIQNHCNYSTTNYHFGFRGNLTTDLTEKIHFQLELDTPSGVIAECSVNPKYKNPVTIFCYIDGFKYDISGHHNLFFSLEDPSTDAFRFENWKEKIREDTKVIVHSSNCPVNKIDYAFTFKKSPIKHLECNGSKRKFQINCYRFTDSADVNDTDLYVYLDLGTPIHRRANCTVNVESTDTTFNCEVELYSPKHYISFNSLNGFEINPTLNYSKHVYIRGDELIHEVFEKCKDDSKNGSFYYFYSSIYAYILLFLYLL